MNSAILLVALAAWCACAGPPAAAAASAAHRTRRGSIPLDMCPAGTVRHYGLCVNVEKVAVPEQNLEAPKPARAKRMIGMFSGVRYFNDCPEEYISLADGRCIHPPEPPQRSADYEDDFYNFFI